MMLRVALVLSVILCAEPAFSQIIYFHRSIWGRNADIGIVPTPMAIQVYSNTSLGGRIGDAGLDLLQDNNHGPQIYMRSYSGASGTAPGQALLEARTARGTFASPAVIKADDILGFWDQWGYNGSGFVQTSGIKMNVEADWSGSNSSSYMSFYTTPLNGNFTEWIRLTGSGSVGIEGNTAPSAKLSFAATTGDKIAIYDPGPSAQFGLGVQSGQMLIYAPSGNRMILGAGGTSGSVTSYLDINLSTGYIVTVGNIINGYTSTDLDSGSNGEFIGKRFAVVTASSNAAFVGLGIVSGFEAQIATGATGSGTELPLDFFIGGSTRERIRLDGVGIFGANSTDASLLAGDWLATGLFSADATTNASIAQFKVISGSYLAITSSHTGSGTNLPMTFWTAGTERMRIDNSGNVGINAAPSADKLNVNGTINSASGYVIGGIAGQSVTTTVRNAANSGSCTIVFTGGLKTGGTC